MNGDDSGLAPTNEQEFDPASELVIDDLRFADLLRMALEAVPGASQGRWTLHGPVDPGITLLELFAWQLEQRMFMAEQPVDPVLRACLRLLGRAEPAATRVARTMLCFRPTASLVNLPAGTSVNLDTDAWGRSVTLDEPITVLPIRRIEVTGLLHEVGDTLELRFAYVGPRLNSEELSMLIDVAAAPGVAPAWTQAAVAAPPPAELRWAAVGPDGSEGPAVVADGTLGFRRSGLLMLPWPTVWNALGSGPCRLRVTAQRGGYTEAVQINGAYANAVTASDRQVRTVSVSEQLAGAPPLPGIRVILPGTAGTLLDGPDEVTLLLTEPDREEHVWTSAGPDWGQAGSADRRFTVDRSRGVLVFGDGRTGRIPRIEPGTAATVEYAVGGGPSGNVGAGSSWVRDGGAEIAENPIAAMGGAEGESLQAASQRATSDLARADRTVTATDAEELALATPGIGLQRAHATLGLHPDFPCVAVPAALSVTVVPHAERDTVPKRWTRAPRPDRGALAATQTQLNAGRLVGQEVFVLPPVYHRVTIWVTLSQTARDETVAARVTEALLCFLDPLRGGSGGDGWPFGGPLRPSALVGVVRRTLGREAEVAELSMALDDGPPTDCDDLTIGERDLLWLAYAHVNWVTAGSGPSRLGLS